MAKQNNKKEFSAEEIKLRNCCEYLNKEGKYQNVEIINTPTDLVGIKEGKKVYIEVKWTSQHDCFGAATFTEWAPMLSDNLVDFVVIKGDNKNDISKWKAYPYESDIFMKYSTIPPFKVNFNIDLKNKEKHTKHPRALCATKENIIILNEIRKMLLDDKQDILLRFINKHKKR